MLCSALLAVVLAGCRAKDNGVFGLGIVGHAWSTDPVRRVVCIYDQRPWLSLDAQGDRDPEGIHYRAFLIGELRTGELRKGEFRIELYRIERGADGTIKRTLASDWILPTDRVPQVRSQIFGMGYHLHLRWADKSLAGNEVELITDFRDPSGGVTRSGTKRLRVPNYSS